MTTSAIYRVLCLSMLAILAAQVVLSLWSQQWLTALFTFGIILIIVIPLLLTKRFHLYIPPPFQFLIIAIIFATLYLGEVHQYYDRVWWWGLAIHAVAGYAVAVVGFLLIHIVGDAKDVQTRIKPGFMAFFAFTLALAAGAAWEMMEFILDLLVGSNLQKPMLGDPSGLTDSMLDLVADTAGAAAICLYGYYHLSRPRTSSFLERWISGFMANNSRLLRRWQQQEHNNR